MMRKAGQPLEFGIFSNGERGNRLAADTYDEDMFEVLVADRLGMTEAWISGASLASQTARRRLLSGHVHRQGGRAALTQQIKPGPAVRPIAIYHPLQVAMDAAMADHLTRRPVHVRFRIRRSGDRRHAPAGTRPQEPQAAPRPHARGPRPDPPLLERG
jgi:hypothetical protein